VIQREERLAAGGGDPNHKTVPIPAAEKARPPSSQEIDDLASQIYAEVRRRLAQEWERRRGGF
jgi:hypothetical protein